MVEELSTEQVDVSVACEVFNVSTSGYYQWLNRLPSQRRRRDKVLCDLISKFYFESRGTYGSPRIYRKLKSQGEKCSQKRVARIMRENDLSGASKKRFKVQTTESNHNLSIAERKFKIEEVESTVTTPNQVWASDITYIPTNGGWVFLCIYLDLFTRKIVGFSMKDHMRSDLLIEALAMALGRQKDFSIKNIMGHSDRGSQYASEMYRQYLEDNGITASMSRKGNCWDNAYAESFFHTLKVELVYREKFETKAEAMRKIFEYIEVWYNRQRLHSSLGYKTPVEYEREQLTIALTG